MIFVVDDRAEDHHDIHDMDEAGMRLISGGWPVFLSRCSEG
jgi:hypothetical protein